MNLNTKLVTMHLQTIYDVSPHILLYHTTTFYSSSRIECYLRSLAHTQTQIYYPSSIFFIPMPPPGALGPAPLSLKHQ